MYSLCVADTLMCIKSNCGAANVVDLDILKLFPEIYMIYTGMSYPVSRNNVSCSTRCYCDQPVDNECCHAWASSGLDYYHCGGVADDRYVFFHGARWSSN